MVSQGTFGDFLEAVEKLSLEDQEALVGVLRKRTAERRRKTFVSDVRAALDEHSAGESRVVSVDELMKAMLP